MKSQLIKKSFHQLKTFHFGLVAILIGISCLPKSEASDLEAVSVDKVTAQKRLEEFSLEYLNSLYNTKLSDKIDSLVTEEVKNKLKLFLDKQKETSSSKSRSRQWIATIFKTKSIDIIFENRLSPNSNKVWTNLNFELNDNIPPQIFKMQVSVLNSDLVPISKEALQSLPDTKTTISKRPRIALFYHLDQISRKINLTNSKLEVTDNKSLLRIPITAADEVLKSWINIENFKIHEIAKMNSATETGAVHNSENSDSTKSYYQKLLEKNLTPNGK